MNRVRKGMKPKIITISLALLAALLPLFSNAYAQNFPNHSDNRTGGVDNATV